MTAHANNIDTIVSIANVLFSGAALIVALASIWFTSRSVKLQEKHNKLSVVPIPFISLADYVNTVRVKIVNNGSGPLIVNEVIVSNGYDSKNDLISWMPRLPDGLFWTNFSSGLINRSVLSGNELILLEIKGKTGTEPFASFRKSCRKVLSTLEVTVDFTDIYNSEFAPVRRKLDWFGRK